MAVKFTKPEINITEKLKELDRPRGIAGQEMLSAETPQEQFNLIGAGRRNIVINGAQNVFQRGSSSVTINTVSEVFRADRFRYEQGSATANNSTIEVSTDAPKGFSYSTQVTAGSSMSFSSAGFTSLNYRGEGTDILGMKNGTSLGSVTLSFWVKCSRPGTYSLNFTTYNGSIERWYLSTYEIHSTEWEYKTITIPSDVSSNASQWFRLYWMLGGDSGAYTGTPGNWINGNGAYRGVSTQPLFNTSGATFKLTGVQLEVGRVATPFEYRSYGEELALCQRYFEVLEDLQSTDSNGAASTETLIGIGYVYTTTRVLGHVTWKVTKRVNPTCTVSPVTDIQCLSSAGSWIGATAIDVRANKNSARLDITTGSAMPAAGQACEIRFDTSSPVGYIYIDAEL